MGTPFHSMLLRCEIVLSISQNIKNITRSLQISRKHEKTDFPASCGGCRTEQLRSTNLIRRWLCARCNKSFATTGGEDRGKDWSHMPTP